MLDCEDNAKIKAIRKRNKRVSELLKEINYE